MDIIVRATSRDGMLELEAHFYEVARDRTACGLCAIFCAMAIVLGRGQALKTVMITGAVLIKITLPLLSRLLNGLGRHSLYP